MDTIDTHESAIDQAAADALALADAHEELVAALRAPAGVFAADWAEHLRDAYTALLEAAGFQLSGGLVCSDDEQRQIMTRLSGADLVALARGEDLPKDHPFLVSLREAAA